MPANRFILAGMTFEELQTAIEFALERHSRHRDQSGEAYSHHARGVYQNASTLVHFAAPVLGETGVIDTRIIAVSHDLIEEHIYTGVTADELLARGYSPHVVAGIERLTYRRGATYQQNIDLLVEEADLGLIIAKAADNEHNLQPERIAALPEEKRSIANRYRKSLLKLARAYESQTGCVYPLPIGRHLLDAA